MRESFTLLTENFNRMDQSSRTIVLGLTITSARQFIELNSRYSNERERESSLGTPHFLTIVPSASRFLPFALSSLALFVRLPRLPLLPGLFFRESEVVIRNEMGLIERISYIQNEEGVPVRFDSLCAFYIRGYFFWAGITDSKV